MKLSNETKIGALTAVAITILILGYSYLRGNDVFSGSNRFYAIYQSVDGLAVSKPVLVNGFQIGRVSKMELRDNGQTVVEFKIDDQYKVPTNTMARLVSTDLLGGKAIVFELGNGQELAQDKDTLRADVAGSLAESLQPIQKKAENLMIKLDSSLASINRIMNPNFERNVDRSFESIANSLQTLEGTTKKIDNIVASQSGHINGILTNAEAVSLNLKNTTNGLTGVTANFQKFSGDLANSNIKQTLDNANKAVANLEQLISNVNSNKGTLGLLMRDDSLYRNLQYASENLDALFIDIKANPKRYVHFSIFGRKNNK
ncbi:MAG: MCE family protein [Sphingobacteriaceae bacterium]|nr:MAG: MCE family protein [Sphingobacteriaceae bacterium]